MTFRLQPGTALDALADSPQTARLGFTQRAHDVALRYGQVLREHKHQLPPTVVSAMAQRFNLINADLPVHDGKELRDALKLLWASNTRFPHLSFVQMISLLEEIEELAYGRPQ